MVPPDEWDFVRYNNDAQSIMRLVRLDGYANLTVPYAANRAVVFDSRLFHQTADFSFARGYGKRRINLTFLYGRKPGNN